ncbi:MAG: TonB-dependent receptor [Pseudomonadota bacterium]
MHRSAFKTNRSYLLTTAAMLAASGSGALAQNDGAGAAISLDADQVIVLGSRGLERSVLDTPVPVDVITQDALESTTSLGGEVGELLQSLVPSFNFPRQSNSGAADTVRTGQLRGLGPDQLLVLVNGKRQHTSAALQLEGAVGFGSAPFDFNTIGSGSIKRIEVLRDGASAQYGSDAIAGVINIVMDDSVEGGTLNSSFGLHATSFDPQDRFITDGETFFIGASYGASLNDRGFIRVGLDYRERNATRRGGFGDLPFFEAQTAPNLATNGQVNFAPGDGDTEDIWVHYNTAYDFGGFEGYSFGRYNSRDAEGVGFFRYPDSSANVIEVFPEGFLPITTGDTEDYSFTGGARGEAAGFSWDLSATYGSNNFEQGASRSINPSFGVDSPTSFRFAEYDRDQLTINADVVKPIDISGLGGPVTVAVGAEYRYEEFSTQPGDPESFLDGGQGGAIGAQTGPGLSPESAVDINRNVYGFYADLDIPLTDFLTVGVAGRYEDYDDFGDALTGKATVFLRAHETLAIRGAVSNSFRAPALAQVGFENFTTNFGIGGQLVTIGQVSVDNPIAIANGAQPLEEETSRNYSAGLIFTPLDALSVTVDVYRIDIDDRLSLREVFPANVTFFTNLVDSQTQGIDVVATYGLPAFGGDLNLTGAASFTGTEVKNPEDIGEEERNVLETVPPDSKIILTSAWTNGTLNTLLRATRFGGVTRDFDFGGGFPDPQRYAAEWSIDSEIGYQVTGKWLVAIGGENLFDNYPDLSSSDNNFFGNLPYDVVQPIGFNGRYVYARTKFDF